MPMRLASRVFLRRLAGHSHYHNIKHRKAKVDARKQTTFQKLSRDIYAAIKSGGGEKDPSKNPRLARAVEAARKASMPKQRIDRAIITVEHDGSRSDTVLFEGVIPGGIGVLVRATATRRNAVAGEMRSLLSHAGGELGKASWMFTERHTVVLRDIDRQYTDEIVMFGIDEGADDVFSDDGAIEFICSSTKDRERLRDALLEKFSFLNTTNVLTLELVEPKAFVSISDEAVARFGRLLSALDDHSDVLDVIHNAKFDVYEEHK